MTQQNRNNRERRIQTRYVVDLHAKVRGRNQLPTNCRVRNICNGGVLLESGYDGVGAAVPARRACGSPFRSARCPEHGSGAGGHRDRASASIEVWARASCGSAGDGRTRLARFVSEQAAASGELDGDLERSPARARAREVLQEVGQQRLGGLLDSLLETLVEELWSHTERAGSDAERTRFAGEIGLLARAVHDEDVTQRLLAGAAGVAAESG